MTPCPPPNEPPSPPPNQPPSPTMPVLNAVLLLAAGLAWALAPDDFLGPYQAFNPKKIAEFVLVTLLISAAARLTVSQLGRRAGTALAGLMGGFASSTATIYAMGALARERHVSAEIAVMGAALSSVATPIQMLVMVRLLAPGMFSALLLPAALALMVLLGVALMAVLRQRSMRHGGAHPNPGVRPDSGAHPMAPIAASPAALHAPHTPHAPHAPLVSQLHQPLVDLRALAVLLGLSTAMTFAAAMLYAELGPRSLPLVGAVSGLVDAHTVIPSMAALWVQGRLALDAAVLPILVSFSVNSVSKCLVAFHAGGAAYGRGLMGGLLLANLGLWLGFYLRA